MAVNLIDRLQSEFSDDVIARLGSFLGETPERMRTAVEHAIPAILLALTQQSETPQGVAKLFSMLQRGGFDGTTSANAASLLQSGADAAAALTIGAPVISSLFGLRWNAVTVWI